MAMPRSVCSHSDFLRVGKETTRDCWLFCHLAAAETNDTIPANLAFQDNKQLVPGPCFNFMLAGLCQSLTFLKKKTSLGTCTVLEGPAFYQSLSNAGKFLDRFDWFMNICRPYCSNMSTICDQMYCITLCYFPKKTKHNIMSQYL